MPLPFLLSWLVSICGCALADQACQSPQCSLEDSQKVHGPFIRLDPPSLREPPQVRNRGALPHDEKAWMPAFLSAPKGDVPAVFQYTGSGGDALGHELADLLDAKLSIHGAVVLKSLPVKSPKDFSVVTQATNWSFIDYVGGVTKRPTVADKVFPASDEPPSTCMEYHNDGSFGARPPTRLFLYSQLPPKVGGQALLYDSRATLRTLETDHPEVLRELRDRKVRYYQFFPDANKFDGEIMTSLQDAFSPKCGGALNFTKAVEEYLVAANYGFKWISTGLTTWRINSPVARHPIHDEETWFNQVTAMHCTLFDNHPMYPALQRAPKDRVEPCKMHGAMPYHTAYGDGGEIPESVIDILRKAQWDNAVAFDFQAGDVAVLDNYFVGHGRFSFEPPREIFTTQAIRGHEITV